MVSLERPVVMFRPVSLSRCMFTIHEELLNMAHAVLLKRREVMVRVQATERAAVEFLGPQTILESASYLITEPGRGESTRAAL